MAKDLRPERQTPPHLRKGTPIQRCGNCRFYDGEGTCKLYSYPVKTSQVCDSFSPR